MKKVVALLSSLALIAGLSAFVAPTATAKKLKGDITLNSVGTRYVGTTIPIKGYISGNTGRAKKTIKLQRYSGGKWHTVATKKTRKNGAYTMPAQKAKTPGYKKYRVRLYVGKKRLDTSKKITVRVIARPVTPPPTKPPVTPPPTTPPVTPPPTTPPVTPPPTSPPPTTPPPTTPPVTPPPTTPPPTTPPPTTPPPASPPSFPDLNLVSVTATTITTSWTPPEQPNGTISAYQFGWVTPPEHPSPPWNGPDIPVADTPNPFTYTDLTPDTEYKVWIRAKNEVGYGEKQWVTVRTAKLVDPPGRPDPVTEERTVVGELRCQVLEVTDLNQERTNTWQWDGTGWMPNWSEWVTTSTHDRAATVKDCVNVVDGVPSNAALPDLRIKRMDQCGQGDRDATGGTCFKIIPSAPYNSDFPKLEGRKLLKFPVITLNVGAGPSEVIADRTGSDATAWKAYQTFYAADGTRLGSVVDPGVEFYYAGDGHNHWHFRDFDDYEILDASGAVVRTAEKHGYCVADNTTYTPFQGKPGVPANPVYLDATSCGKGLPNALTMIQGLSKGWGDTYPTSLPDQAIDITDLPDGVYTVRVHANAKGAIVESDSSNNTASAQVRITGDTVERLSVSGGVSD